MIHACDVTYVRRFLADGTAHICAQCQFCGKHLRLAEHKYRLYLRLEEVPMDASILPWNNSAKSECRDEV